MQNLLNNIAWGMVIFGIGGLIVIQIIEWLTNDVPDESDDGETNEDEVYEFKNRLSRLGDPTAPERIKITPTTVTWSKNKGYGELWLSSDEVTIHRSKITGVIINSKLVGCGINISSSGFNSINARAFSQEDANAIRDILS